MPDVLKRPGLLGTKPSSSGGESVFLPTQEQSVLSPTEPSLQIRLANIIK